MLSNKLYENIFITSTVVSAFNTIRFINIVNQVKVVCQPNKYCSKEECQSGLIRKDVDVGDQFICGRQSDACEFPFYFG